MGLEGLQLQVVPLKVERRKTPTPWVEVDVLGGRPSWVVWLGHDGQGLQVEDPGSLLPCCDKKCFSQGQLINSVLYLDDRSFNSSSFSVFLAKQKSVTLFWKVTSNCVRSL